MDINDIPCEATLRQRMDNHADKFLPIVEKASRDFLCNIQPTLRPLSTGHIPIDADVTPMDNSGSHKEGVSRTYKGHDGFAPMAVYLGQEGYCIDFEFREGKQHCQKDTPALLAKALKPCPANHNTATIAQARRRQRFHREHRQSFLSTTKPMKTRHPLISSLNGIPVNRIKPIGLIWQNKRDNGRHRGKASGQPPSAYRLHGNGEAMCIRYDRSYV